ncbi:MFS transporter [Niveispirillum sp. KHB5.9]|uniref:MFS transporter n=1 Tax=Niveispirillum sp. KHB5.9 TaxID=3400269 RepID=UPI003A85C19B
MQDGKADAQAATRQSSFRVYALAHLGKSLLWTLADVLTILMLIRHGGMNPVTAGLVFLTGLVWNALADPLVGSWMDRRLRRGASLVPAMAAAAPGACLFFLAGLLVPSGTSVPLVILAGMLFRTCFSLYDVPHNAMMTRLAGTPRAQADLAGLRTIAHGLASIVAGLAVVPLADAGTSPLLVQLILAAVAVVALLCMGPCLRLVVQLENLPETPVPAAGDVPRPPDAPGLAGLCLVTVAGALGLGLVGKAVPHLDWSGAGMASLAMPLLMAGRFLAAWCARPLVDRLGTTRALAASYLLAAPACLGLPLLTGGGVLSPVGLVVLGICLTVPTILSWVELAQVVRAAREGFWRAHSMVGLFTMVSKLATGAAGLLLGIVLDVQMPGPGPQGIMTPDQLSLVCLLVAGGTLVAAGMLWRGARHGRSAKEYP